MRTLVLGGIRSGKSQWAESAIIEYVGGDGPVRYVATGPNGDSEPAWSARVCAHRARRPKHWSTVESVDLAGLLSDATANATLVDDLGCWLTAVLDARAWDDVSVAVDEFLTAMDGFGSPLVLVSPEVGLTVVPPTPSGRRFADELGGLNQRVAAACDRVVLVVAGQPMIAKDSHHERS